MTRECMRSQVPTSMSSKRRNLHHLPSSSSFFFRIILKTALQRGHLKLTSKFTRNHGGGMPNPVLLKPLDGTEWKVHWTEHDDRIWFEKGWKEFATYYSLDHGHFVLFEYKESSHFDVRICDKSTHEIEYPFYDSQDVILDEPPMSSPNPRKKLRTSSCADVGTSSNLPNMSQDVQMEGNQSKGTNFEKPAFASVEKELDENKGGGTECLIVEEEELNSESADALKRATTFQSKITNPSFMVVMKPAYVNASYLGVTSQFARKYLKKKQRDILPLVLDGKTWPVSYSNGRFNSGWKKFVLDNHLKVGDVCLFELTKSQDLSLKARIFQDLEEPHSSPSQVSAQVDEVDGKEIDHGRILNDKSKENKADGTECPKVEKKKLTSKIDEALKRAKTFKSKITNPCFMVVMQPSYITYYLGVTSQFARKYLKKKQGDILPLILDGKTWPVCFSDGRFNGGWKKFASDNHLNVGDVCLFELTNIQEFSLETRIFRVLEESHSSQSQVSAQVNKVNGKEIDHGRVLNAKSKGSKATQKASLLISPRSSPNEALQRANKFTSKNPFFTINIKSSQQWDNRPYVPRLFVKEHLNNNKRVKLLYGKKIWPVEIHMNTSILSKGWAEFAKGSKLVGEDVCVFELIYKEDAVLLVHIYRGHR